MSQANCQGLQGSPESGGPAVFVLSGAVPLLGTVISPSRRWNKGRTQEGGSTSQCHSPAPGPPALCLVENCRISSTAQTEVFLFRKGNEGAQEWGTSSTGTATRGPNPSSQFLRIQSPCWHRKESFYKLGGGNVTLLASVSSSSQNFERKQRGIERKGQVGEELKFLDTFVGGRWPAGPRQWQRRRPFLPSSIPQPQVSLFSSG